MTYLLLVAGEPLALVSRYVLGFATPQTGLDLDQIDQAIEAEGWCGFDGPTCRGAIWPADTDADTLQAGLAFVQSAA